MNVWIIAVSFLIGATCGVAVCVSISIHMYHELQKGEQQKREKEESKR